MEAAEAVFLRLLVSDTGVVQQAEAEIKEMLRLPSSVEICMGLLAQSQHCAVRQLAAVLLAKRINTHWARLPPAAQAAVPQQLLQSLNEDPDRLARRSVARLIAVLAKNLLAVDQWGDLLPTLAGMVGQGAEHQREAAFQTFHCLSEVVATKLGMHFTTMRDIYLAGMGDPERSVRVASMRAAVMLVVFLSDTEDVQQFAELVPRIIALVQDAADDDELLTSTFEVLGQIAESRVRMLGPHIAQLVEMLLAVAQSQNTLIGTRDSALGCLTQLIKFKPRLVAKANLVSQIVFAAMSLIASASATAASLGELMGQSDGTPDEDQQQYQMAASLVDKLATHIPKKYIFRPTVELCLGALGHENASARKAAITFLGLIAEGCAEPLNQSMEELLPPVLNACADPAAEVRENALFCLGQWSEHCENILAYHEQLLPVVYAKLDEPGLVQKSSCYVLECFCEQLDGETVLTYLHMFMAKLVAMLQGGDRSIVDIAIAAISAFAIGADDSFTQYVEPVVAILEPLLQLAGEEDMQLRGRAMECLGYVAKAVGPDGFRPHLAASMHAAAQGLQFESYELSDFTYGFIVNMARTFEEEFTPYVEIAEHLIGIISMSDEGAFTEEVRGANSGGPQVNFAIGGDAEKDDDDEDGKGLVIMHVRTAMLEMKVSCINALGAVCLATGDGFAPYLSASYEALSKLSSYFQDDVRKAVAENIKYIATVGVLCYHPQGLQDGEDLHAEAREVVQHVLLHYYEIFQDEPEGVVVAQACWGVQHVLELCEGTGLDMCASWVLEKFAELLGESAPCQENVDEVGEDDEDEEGESEHDNVLDAVTDVLAAVARIMGADFAEPMRGFFPLLMEYTRPQRTEVDRYMAIGCLAELAEAIGPHCEEYVNAVVPLIVAGMTSDSPHLQRNSAYCAGLFGLHGGATMQGHTLDVLQALRPLVSPDVAPSVCDNAVSAVARIIMAPGSNAPLDAVVPVFLSALPLREDMMENVPVYQCLTGLLTAQVPALMNLLPQVVTIIGNIIAGDDISDAQKGELCVALQAAGQANPAVLQAALQQADPAAAENLRAAGVL